MYTLTAQIPLSSSKNSHHQESTEDAEKEEECTSVQPPWELPSCDPANPL